VSRNSIILSRHIKLFLYLFIGTFFCSYLYGQYSTNEKQESQKLITLIGTIGEDDTKVPKEYLLVMPNTIAVSDSGDILLSDEYYIKVFDRNLKPKIIIGGHGQGPGEFRGPFPFVRIMPGGYISVRDNVSDYYSLFDSHYKFIFSKKISPSPRFSDFLEKKGFSKSAAFGFTVSCFDRERMLYSGLLTGAGESYYSLNYEDKNIFIPIYFISSTSVFVYFEALNDSVIVYIINNSDNINYVSDEKGEYTVHFFNINTQKEEKAVFPFKPVLITDDYIKRTIERMSNSNKNIDRSATEKALKNKKYFWPIVNMLNDRDYIFVFYRNLNNDNVSVMQVIDTKTKKIVYQGESSFGRDLWFIRNGNMYDRKTPGGFVRVNVYKINPIVYGKPADPNWMNKKN